MLLHQHFLHPLLTKEQDHIPSLSSSLLFFVGNGPRHWRLRQQRPPIAEKEQSWLHLYIHIFSFWPAYFYVDIIFFIQHCFACRPSDFTVLEDAGTEPRTVATFALADRRLITTVLDLTDSGLYKIRSAKTLFGATRLRTMHSELRDRDEMLFLLDGKK